MTNLHISLLNGRVVNVVYIFVNLIVWYDCFAQGHNAECCNAEGHYAESCDECSAKCHVKRAYFVVKWPGCEWCICLSLMVWYDCLAHYRGC